MKAVVQTPSGFSLIEFDGNASFSIPSIANSLILCQVSLSKYADKVMVNDAFNIMILINQNNLKESNVK